MHYISNTVKYTCILASVTQYSILYLQVKDMQCKQENYDYDSEIYNVHGLEYWSTPHGHVISEMHNLLIISM